MTFSINIVLSLVILGQYKRRVSIQGNINITAHSISSNMSDANSIRCSYSNILKISLTSNSRVYKSDESKGNNNFRVVKDHINSITDRINTIVLITAAVFKAKVQISITILHTTVITAVLLAGALLGRYFCPVINHKILTRDMLP